VPTDSVEIAAAGIKASISAIRIPTPSERDSSIVAPIAADFS
jgi:hypothetical protein